jgi:uncharacterized protein
MYAPKIPETGGNLAHPYNLDELNTWAYWLTHHSPPEQFLGYGAAQLDTALTQAIQLQRRETENIPKTRHLGQFIIKTVTDCNLRCIYPCYEYVDDTWRSLPAVMPDEVVTTLGRRIGEYAALHGLKRVSAVFHGGEPLLMKKPEAYYARIIPLLLQNITELAPDTAIELGMVTNGTLLRPSILDVLKRHDVGISVSVDGGRESHNARRLTKHGQRGSYNKVMRGLDYLRSPAYASLFRRVLAVINIDADPIAFYKDLLALNPPEIDLLFPHATHDNPPPQPKDQARRTATPYADWLIPIFWSWRSNSSAPPLRLFRSIMRLDVGGASFTENIGPDTGGEVVVRTDGSLELVDALKVTTEGLVATNMNVTTHNFEQVAEFLRSKQQLGKKAVASACQGCPVLDTCGGGHLSQRYSSERLFDNASVYCDDLMALINEISRATRSYLRIAMAVALKEGKVPRLPNEYCM